MKYLASFAALLISVRLLSANTVTSFGGERASETYELASNIMFGVFYGLLVALIFYSLAVFIVIRERIYLYFISFLPALLLYYLNANGIGASVLWMHSGTDWLNLYGSNVLFFPLVMIPGSILCLRFLDTKQYFPRLHSLLVVLTLVQSLAFLSRLFGGDTLTDVLHYLAAATALLIIVIACILAKKRSGNAGKFILILPFAVIGYIIQLLTDHHFISRGLLTTNATQIGIAFSVLAFSVVIATSLSRINREKRLAEKNALLRAQEMEQLGKEQQSVLEQKVEERTATLEKMHAALVQQEKMASMGKLTNVLAKEIKEPIDVISDFSGRSQQLLDAIMKAQTATERDALITDLSNNLKRINQQGRQADNILKKTFDYLRKGKIEDGLFGE